MSGVNNRLETGTTESINRQGGNGDVQSAQMAHMSREVSARRIRVQYTTARRELSKLTKRGEIGENAPKVNRVDFRAVGERRERCLSRDTSHLGGGEAFQTVSRYFSE